MSQQHLEFEEEFRDGPPPAAPYQAGYAGPPPAPSYPTGYTNSPPLTYTVDVPPGQAYINSPGQKLLVHDIHANSVPGVGARLALSILSLIFTFVTFIVALGVIAASRFDLFPMAPIAIFFALIFAVVVIVINIIFSHRH
ncbi:MAG: hypothetical protein ACRDHZ_17175 [Ktedonobacteraceae bacterium]